MDPSWAELRHFVNFLNSQLQSCEESTFCNMEHVGDTLEGFRSFVVNFMILMSQVGSFKRSLRHFHQFLVRFKLTTKLSTLARRIFDVEAKKKTV